MLRTLICHSRRNSYVKRKSYLAHCQGDILDLCQLYQVRISSMMYAYYGDMKMLLLGTKGSIAVEMIYLYLQLQDDIFFWKIFNKEENLRIYLLYSFQIRPGEFFVFEKPNYYHHSSPFYTTAYPLWNRNGPTCSSKQVVQVWFAHCYHLYCIFNAWLSALMEWLLTDTVDRQPDVSLTTWERF